MVRFQASAQVESISAALDAVTPRLAEFAACDLFVGTDPVFAGVHNYVDVGDGRSYRDTACCAYGAHTIDKLVTICLPKPVDPWVVVHEIGHVIDAATRFEWTADPCTQYAALNRWEAFAEAFTAWIGCYRNVRPSPADAAFFEALAW